MTVRIFWDGLGLDQPCSGIYQHARFLLKHLHELKTFPHIVGTNELGEDFKLHGTRLVANHWLLRQARRFKPFWSLQVFHAIKGILKSQPADRVILHGLANVNLPTFVSKPKNWRYVLTIHDLIPLLEGTEPTSKFFSRIQFRNLLKHHEKTLDAVIAISKWTADHIEEFYPALRTRIHLIPNGSHIHAAPDGADIIKRTGQSLPMLNGLVISRFAPHKRLDRVVTILRTAPPGTLTLTVVTDQRGEEYFHLNASDLMKSDTLRLEKSLGAEKLRAFYQTHDFLLLTSEYEGFGLPAADALQFGMPVVYQKGSALDEFIAPAFGIAVAKDAPISVWVHACELAVSKSLKEEFSGELRTYLKSLNSWKDSADRLKSLYESIF